MYPIRKVRFGYPPKSLNINSLDFKHSIQSLGLLNGDQLFIDQLEQDIDNNNVNTDNRFDSNLINTNDNNNNNDNNKDNKNNKDSIDGHSVRINGGEGYMVLRVNLLSFYLFIYPLIMFLT